MALTFTSRDSSEGFVAGPITSASVSLAAGSVMLVSCQGFPDVTATPTATGLTFTLINSVSTGARGVYIWRSLIGGSGFSGTVTMFTSSDHMLLYDIVEVTGAVTTGTNASDAIVQSLGFGPVVASSPFTENYSSTFAQSTNGGYAAMCIDQGAYFAPESPRSGWTVSAGGAGNPIAMYIASSDTAAGFSSTSPFGNIQGVMIEVAAATVVAPPSPFVFHRYQTLPRRRR